jgi:hypothetical protein
MSDIRDDVAEMFGAATVRAEVLSNAKDILFELACAELDAMPNMVRTSFAIGLVNTMAQEWRKQAGELPPLFVTMLREIADGRVS